MRHRGRQFRVFTCDRGRRWVRVDEGSPDRIAAILQELVESGFWREIDRFPVDVIAKTLPLMSVPRYTRRLLEIWVEERAR